jgi:hypothetical protein
MRDYRSMLEDHIHEHGLFESKDEGSIKSSKKSVIDYAINFLLKPDWDFARINYGIREESEAALVETIVCAVSNTIFDFIGLGCEEEVKKHINNKLRIWHKDYNIRFE